MVAPVNMARGVAAVNSNRQRAANNPNRSGANVGQPAVAANLPDAPHRHHEDAALLRGGERIDNVANAGFMAEFMLPMVAMPLAWVAGKIPFVGVKAKDGVNALLVKPFEVANATTVGDVMRKVGVGNAVAAFHSPVPNMKVPTASVVASTGAFSKDTFLARRAGQAATKAITGLHTETGAMLGALGKEGGGVLGSVKGLFSRNKQAAHVTPSYLHGVEGHLKAFQGALAGEAHLVDVASAHGYLDEALAAVKALPETAPNKIVNTLHADITGMKQRLHQAGNLATSARGQQTLGGALKQGVKGATLRDVGIKGGLGIGALYFAGRSATNFRDNLKMLKEMNSDLTGKPTSTLDVLRSNLDGLAIPARSNMMKRFGVEAIGAAASIATNLVFMRRNPNMAIMLGAGGVQMATAELSPKENYLDAYFAVKDMKAAGMDVPVEAYAELIAAASTEAQEAGGAGSRLVLKVAEEYAERAVPPTVILKEIQGKTQFQHRAEVAMEKIKAEDVAEREAVADEMIAAKKAAVLAQPQTSAQPIAEKPKTPELPGTAMLAAQASEHQGKVVERNLEKGSA